MVRMVKPNDIYVDSSLHPCLCLGVESDGAVWGISLVDGSYPRTVSPRHELVRKLTLEEAWVWRRKGPQDCLHSIPSDEQWWWPKAAEATNLGSFAEHFFGFSLFFLRTQPTLIERLGAPLLGWYEPSCQLDDREQSGTGEASYEVRGSRGRGHVTVTAAKEGRLWPIQEVRVSFEDDAEPLSFTGEAVRGCGRAT